MLDADRYYPYNPWVDPGIRGTTHGSTRTRARSPGSGMDKGLPSYEPAGMTRALPGQTHVRP